MAKLFYYRHKIGDYDTSTKDLSMLEHGCYRRLMDGYYANKGPISSAFPTLCRIAGAFMPDEQAALRKIVGMYFDAESQPGYLVHAVCDEEIIRVLSESERQSAAAKSRWAKEADLSGSDAVAHAVVCASAVATVPAAAPAGADAVAMPVKIQDSKKALPPISPDPPFKLPLWVPPDTWREFEKMRQRIRKPMTDYAKERLVKKLDTIRQLGHDPKLVLDESIEHSWVGVFPLKVGHQVVRGKRSQVEASNDQSAENWANGEPHA